MRIDRMPEIDRAVPAATRTACFALGCYWEPEGMYGGTAGVVGTRVGFAGGDYPNPTYHKLVDHRETVEVRYDPSVVAYEDLVRVFWHAHNPGWAGVLLRFAAALFYTGEDERRIANELAEERAREDDKVIRTPVMPLSVFHPADASHQKHYLRGERELVSEFREIYPQPWAFTRSTATARVNAVLAGHGEPPMIREEIGSYGLSRAGRERVLRRLEQRG